MARIDFGSVFALVEIFLAAVVIVIMQCVARNPDFRSPLGWLKWGHRLAFVIVAAALITNAGVTLDSGSNPRMIDVATIGALLAVLAISVSRHGLAARQARPAEAPARPPASFALFRLLILGVGLALALLVPALAHDSWIMKGGHRNAAGEWCCGEGDCFVIPGDQVTTTDRGYLLFGAELVPYAEAQASPDGAFWRCKRPDGSRRCFFAPPPAT